MCLHGISLSILHIIHFLPAKGEISGNRTFLLVPRDLFQEYHNVSSGVGPGVLEIALFLKSAEYGHLFVETIHLVPGGLGFCDEGNGRVRDGWMLYSRVVCWPGI